ncbi:uncharacterized protein LOC113138055 [Mastacembelus armatus]|uniref:uncharacterized protein LOC113138055 n=1 Tax=Mastacembelus armatus TaxID=205130 RepID=UPI000E462596|nr:uncharacterized protein LOC113138055 [Mastacembelus armatus]
MTGLKLSIVLQGLALFLFGPVCEASSLGLTVHAVPLDSDGGEKVQAFFSAIAPSPCPDLSGLCAKGEDCLVYTTSSPFNGTKPMPNWCVRQWQKTVPSNYSATISLGSKTEIYVSMKAGPNIRANNGKLNQPPYVALLPPLRARVNCPHDFHLPTKDLDGDKVRCRFARPEQGECLNCTQHSFIELDEEECMLAFTGEAPAGQYFIYLMAEDLIPAPTISHITDSPLSSIPVHLSLTVEKSSTSCSEEPVATGDTPKDNSMLVAMPYQELAFNVYFVSQLESVSEIAVVGPPELYRTGFQSVGPLAMMTMAWVRSENKLARLLPICFIANTQSLQSEPRCVWLYQREARSLPQGTELTCTKTEMILVLPITSLDGINLAELQLNSPTCPISYNSTYLTAHISLNGCGTKTVHSGSELVYTNTLQSVHPYTVVSRQPSLILPLACRIPGIQARGPEYKVSMPTEVQTFGVVKFWLEFHRPEEGPVTKILQSRRKRRQLQTSESNSTSSELRLNQLDLYVRSNCSVPRAELIVSKCIESEMEDFSVFHPLLQQGCLDSSSTLPVTTNQTNVKVYRLDLGNLKIKGSTMFIQCTVNLCIATMPSQTCPNLCSRSLNSNIMVNSVFTKTYTIKSGAVSVLVNPPVTTTPDSTPTNPTTTSSSSTSASSSTTTATTNINGNNANTNNPTAATITKPTVAQNNQQNSTSHAPQQTSAVVAGVILTTLSIFHQNIFLL